MITAAQVREILKQYEKHGWHLRRVLLCPTTRAGLASALESLFGDAPVISSETDALWFSRPSPANGSEAWELRRLSATPFALVKVFDAETNEADREQSRREMEKRLV